MEPHPPWGQPKVARQCSVSLPGKPDKGGEPQPCVSRNIEGAGLLSKARLTGLEPQAPWQPMTSCPNVCFMLLHACPEKRRVMNATTWLAGWLRTVGRSRVQRGQLPCGHQAQRPATSPAPPPSAAPAPAACLGSWHRPSSSAHLLTKGRGGEGGEGCRHPKMDSAGMPAAASGHSGCGPCTWLAGHCVFSPQTDPLTHVPASLASCCRWQAGRRQGRQALLRHALTPPRPPTHQCTAPCALLGRHAAQQHCTAPAAAAAPR